MTISLSIINPSINRAVLVSLTDHNDHHFSQIGLQPYNAKQAQFRIMPKYKVRAEGNVVSGQMRFTVAVYFHSYPL